MSPFACVVCSSEGDDSRKAQSDLGYTALVEHRVSPAYTWTFLWSYNSSLLLVSQCRFTDSYILCFLKSTMVEVSLNSSWHTHWSAHDMVSPAQLSGMWRTETTRVVMRYSDSRRILRKRYGKAKHGIPSTLENTSPR